MQSWFALQNLLLLLQGKTQLVHLFLFFFEAPHYNHEHGIIESYTLPYTYLKNPIKMVTSVG